MIDRFAILAIFSRQFHFTKILKLYRIHKSIASIPKAGIIQTERLRFLHTFFFVYFFYTIKKIYVYFFNKTKYWYFYLAHYGQENTVLLGVNIRLFIRLQKFRGEFSILRVNFFRTQEQSDRTGGGRKEISYRARPQVEDSGWLLQ